MTTSKDSSAHGSVSMSPTRKSPSGIRSRAISTRAGVASRPETWAPRSAAMRQKRPAPQPTSSSACVAVDPDPLEDMAVDGDAPAVPALHHICPVAGALTPEPGLHRRGAAGLLLDLSHRVPRLRTPLAIALISARSGSSADGGGSVRAPAGSLIAVTSPSKPPGVRMKSILQPGVPDRVAVRDVAGPEGVVARPRLDRRVADLERDLAVEHPESFVLVVVDVQRRLGTRRLGHLDDGHLPAGVGGTRLDDGKPAEPPAGFPLVA